MISLNGARNLVEKVRGEEISLIYTDLTLRNWAREGVISHMKVENGNAFYPDIVAAEILTAINLKEKYSLSKIAEARRSLELEGGKVNQITEDELIRFINCSKLFNDKKLVTKLAIDHIESLDKIKELIDELLREKEHLEVVGDYLREFIKAGKEINNIIENKERKFIS